jgi:hypothetical protein
MELELKNKYRERYEAIINARRQLDAKCRIPVCATKKLIKRVNGMPIPAEPDKTQPLKLLEKKI